MASQHSDMFTSSSPKDGPDAGVQATRIHAGESSPEVSTDHLDEYSASPKNDHLHFRQRLRETERRFREQMQVHRGINAALRDVDTVQRQAQLLKSEEKVTQALSLLRLRQDDLFAKAGEAASVSPMPQTVYTDYSPLGVPAFGVQQQHPPQGHGATTGSVTQSLFSPLSAPPPAPSPTTASPASPLRDILEAFSKPRASRIPPPPLLQGSSAQPETSRRRLNKPTVPSVNLTNEVPQPYVQIRWVRRHEPTNDASRAETSRQDKDQSGESGMLPEVEETQAAFVSDGEGGSDIYSDDFVENATDSISDEAGSVPIDEASSIGEESTRHGSSGIHTEKDSDVSTASRGSRVHSIVTDAVSSGASAGVGSDLSSVRTASVAGDSFTDSLDHSHGRHGRKDRRHNRRSGTQHVDPTVATTAAQALSEFQRACQSANKLVAVLSGESDPSAQSPAPPGVSSGTEREFRRIRKLRKVNEHLQQHLADLDLERKARRVKGELLRRAHALAKAHRALTEDEEALLEEVVPNAKALLERRRSVLAEKAKPTRGEVGSKGKSSRGKKRRSRRRYSDSIISSLSDVVEDLDSALDSDGVIQSDSGIVEDLYSSDAFSERNGSSIAEEIGEDSALFSDSGAFSTISEDELEEDYSDDYMKDESDGVIEEEGSSPLYSDSFEADTDDDGGVVEEDEAAMRELEEAVERAMDEHGVEHVFARHGESGAALGAEQRLIAKLADAAASDLSSVMEEIDDIADEDAGTPTQNKKSQQEKAPSSVASAVASVHSGASASSSPVLSARSASATSDEQPTSYADSEPSPSDSLTRMEAKYGHLLSSNESDKNDDASVGEKELQALEDDIAVTQHRRKRALRTLRHRTSEAKDVSRLQSVEGEEAATGRGEGGGHLDRDGVAIPTFTQLYDPDVSSLSSHSARGGEGYWEDDDEPSALRQPSGEVLLRLKAAKKAAHSPSLSGRRILVAEKDLLRSTAGVHPQTPAGPQEEVPTAGFASGDAKETETQVVQPAADDTLTLAPQPRMPEEDATRSSTENDGKGKPSSGLRDASTSTAALPSTAHPASPAMPSNLPNLSEDFVALAAWKEKQIALCKTLRQHHGDLPDDDKSEDDDAATSPLGAVGGDETEGGGSFSHHWGVLQSLLETRFGRRRDDAADEEYFLSEVPPSDDNWDEGDKNPLATNTAAKAAGITTRTPMER